ncbi:MAG: beta-N-acetylhexosaminidase [Firmicutes bacterium]|nr:beta-N-acetylhexosaminidase [Bacillota bacterium]
MDFNIGGLPASFAAALVELEKELDFRLSQDGESLVYEKTDELRVSSRDRVIVIGAPHLPAFLKAFCFILSGKRRLCLKIRADRLSFMADLSRNAVLKTETLKKWIRLLAINGYTELQLYTEDTYEVENEPYFGYLRGRLSCGEIKEVVEYGMKFGIETVPCIQTLAHLSGLLRWQNYQECFDCADILLVGSERVYRLLENMFASLRKAYKTDKINIGMDEAELLGSGRYFRENGWHPKAEIMDGHLTAVLKLCEKYGFSPSMWSDMFFKNAYRGKYYALDEPVTPAFREGFRGGVSLIYWDYYHQETGDYVKMIKKHKALTEDFSFAGGAWKWSGFAPLLSLSLKNGAEALKACAAENVRSLMLTAWGDNGAECSIFAVLPVVALYSDYVYGGKFEVDKRLFGAFAGDYDSFIKLELANRLKMAPMLPQTNCSSKYFLYNDLLLGSFDSNVDTDTGEIFKRNAEEILAAKEKVGKFGYLFDTLASLSDLLSIKADFGVRLRGAYEKGDTETLKKLLGECAVMLEKTDEFYALFSRQWNRENKRNGFEVQTARLGGLKQRMRDVSEILCEYLEGNEGKIPELEEKRLDFMGGGSLYSKQTDILYNNYVNSVTVNVF